MLSSIDHHNSLEIVNPNKNICLLNKKLNFEVKNLNRSKSIFLLKKIVKTADNIDNLYLYIKANCRDLNVSFYNPEDMDIDEKVINSNKTGIFKIGNLYVIRLDKDKIHDVLIIS